MFVCYCTRQEKIQTHFLLIYLKLKERKSNTERICSSIFIKFSRWPIKYNNQMKLQLCLRTFNNNNNESLFSALFLIFFNYLITRLQGVGLNSRYVAEYYLLLLLFSVDVLMYHHAHFSNEREFFVVKNRQELAYNNLLRIVKELKEEKQKKLWILNEFHGKKK